MYEILIVVFADDQLMTGRVVHVESFLHIVEPNTIVVSFRIVIVEYVFTVVHIKENGITFLRESYFNVRWFTQTDAMFESVLYERD